MPHIGLVFHLLSPTWTPFQSRSKSIGLLPSCPQGTWAELFAAVPRSLSAAAPQTPITWASEQYTSISTVTLVTLPCTSCWALGPTEYHSVSYAPTTISLGHRPFIRARFPLRALVPPTGSCYSPVPYVVYGSPTRRRMSVTWTSTSQILPLPSGVFLQ